MLASQLASSDEVLSRVEAGEEEEPELSTLEARQHSTIRVVQQGLLSWDPHCLPLFGANGDVNAETLWALTRFSTEVVGEEQVEPAYLTRDLVLALDAALYDVERNESRRDRVSQVDAWLTPALSGVFSAVSTSDLVFHPTGASAFAAFRTAVEECQDSQAFIVISGWDFWPDCPMGPGGVTIADVLRDAGSRGVGIRALINRFPEVNTLIGSFGLGIGNNTSAVNLLRSLPNSAVIHDKRVLHHTVASLGIFVPGVFPIQLGVHHQKAWVVWTGHRLVAWCGGIDFNPNRTGPTPFHDVQTEVTGKGALDIYTVLRLRWQDHPDRPPTVFLPILGPSPVSGTHRVRVTTTFGDPTQFAGLFGPPYLFAPTGSKATRQLLLHLIGMARSFIYVEDQYFVDPNIGLALAAAMPRIRALIVVMPDSNAVNGELHQAFARRRVALAPLAPFADKIAVVTNFRRFVHSKTWIFDDIVVMNGSSNVNRRGFEHDSEMSVTGGDIAGTGTVRDLRERLWRFHLGPAAPPDGSDPVSALGTWQNPPPTASVSRIDWLAGTDPQPIPLSLLPFLSAEQFWQIVDPGCP